jgi:hypothetical protein
MTLVAPGLLLGMVGLMWVMFIDITQADHQTKRQSPRRQDKPLVDATRRAGFRHSRFGTVDSVLNQKKIVPDGPQFLHHFYFLRSRMKADK